MCSGKADKSNYDNVTELGANLLYRTPKLGHGALSSWTRRDSVRFRYYYVRIELRAAAAAAAAVYNIIILLRCPPPARRVVINHFRRRGFSFFKSTARKWKNGPGAPLLLLLLLLQVLAAAAARTEKVVKRRACPRDDTRTGTPVYYTLCTLTRRTLYGYIFLSWAFSVSERNVGIIITLAVLTRSGNTRLLKGHTAVVE